MAIAVLLYLAIAHGAVGPWFLLAGYGTIYMVIVFKVVGRMMVSSSQECAGAATTDTSRGSSGGP
jgi:hypothetical protein